MSEFKTSDLAVEFRQWLPTGTITAQAGSERGPGRPMWFEVRLLNQYGDCIGWFETTTRESRDEFIAHVNRPVAAARPTGEETG